MAHLLNRFNRQDYQRALEALAARSGETVLELGFGGGIGVDALLKRGVRVWASEPSVDMRARAHRRWAWPLAKGELEVWPHAAEQLPEERSVDRALSMNTVYFWQDIELGFRRLRSIVRRRLVLGIASPQHLLEAGFDEEGFRVREVDWYRERLQAAGFATSVTPSPSPEHCALLIGEPPAVDP